MAGLPATIVAVDVETTGFYSTDRIVSLGALRVSTSELANDLLNIECMHIIADPGKKSHSRAEQKHGYSDWTLRHQQPFLEHAQGVRKFLSSGDIVVAHNASFDLDFISREFRMLGEPAPKLNSYCTLDGYRQLGLEGRATLDAICDEMGLRRIGTRHGALEDAWLALMIYFWLHRIPSRHIQSFATIASRGVPVVPSNFQEPPPIPEGRLPRRRAATVRISRTSEITAANTASKIALMKAVRPTAILLLEVARAGDALAAEEVEILVSLLRSTRDRLCLLIDIETEREVLAELFDIKISQNMLTRAARAVYEDSAARQAFPKWLASIATADGYFSDAERAAVDRVKAAIKRVLLEVDRP